MGRWQFYCAVRFASQLSGLASTSNYSRTFRDFAVTRVLDKTALERNSRHEKENHAGVSATCSVNHDVVDVFDSVRPQRSCTFQCR